MSDDGAPAAGTPNAALWAGLVLAALLSFSAVVYFANFTGAAPSPPDGPAGSAPFEARGKRAGAPPAPLVPSEELWVVGGPPVERPDAPEGAPNVVLVLMTAVRRDALEPYGAPAGRSPAIAALAARGARFGDVIAAAPHPRGAEIAVLTGQHAASIDAVDPGPGPESRPVAPEVETLAERLQGAGWATIGLTANHNLNVDGGLTQGFDRYRQAQAQSFRPAARIDAAELVREASRALGERPEPLAERPFYLQLSMVDAHSPLRRYKALEAQLDPQTPNAQYRAAVRTLDDALDLLLDELDALGHKVGEDTLLVVVSEHGEGNNDPEHHGRFHGHLMYETAVGIPWIVVGPNVLPGRVIGGLASQTDVMPTLLELAGVPVPHELDGRSWAAQLRGEGDRTDRQRAFADTWYFGTSRASIWTPTTACQKDYGSLPTEGGAFAEGCYDRTIDPEFRNLQRDDALMAELDAWRAEVASRVTGAAPPAGDAANGGDGEVGEDAGAAAEDPTEPEAAG
jgi:arylsulfatase A-like enzyme